MAVPVVYRKSGEQILANYDWADYLEGVGYLQYYFVGTRHNVGGSGTNFFNLSRKATPSHSLNKTMTGTANNTFSTTINSPIIIGGANALFVCRNEGISITIRGQVYKNSTLIGEIADPSASAAVDGSVSFEVPITKTAFAIGDVLNIKITTASGGYFHFDPEDTLGASYVMMPVRINR